MRQFLIFLLPVFCLLVPADGFGQESTTPVRSSVRNTMTPQVRDTQQMVSSLQHLNVLMNRGNQLITLQNRERDSIIAASNNLFAKGRNNTAIEIARQEAIINDLKSSGDSLETEQAQLLFRLAVFLIVLLVVSILILTNRFRVFAKSKNRLKKTESVRNSLSAMAGTLEEKTKKLEDLRSDFERTYEMLHQADRMILTPVADKTHKLHKSVKQLMDTGEHAIHMMRSVNPAGENNKVVTNLNLLIEETISQALFATRNAIPEFDCKIIRDLEKILPAIEVYPSEIRFVLFNLIENALYAVWKKRGNSPKGYEPTVTITSRKLPRFIQIRVKDNGTGIEAGEEKNLFSPYYSKRTSDSHPGLGLYHSRNIITKNHKGELFIESNLVNSTDFIIRFPVNTVQ